MAIELHHLHPGHDDELSRLKARIAELEKENQTLAEDVSDKIESITELMELVKKYKSEKADLEEERRWRKFSEEKPPKYTWCLVSGKNQMGNYIVITDFFEEDDWAENPNLDDDSLDIEWWIPLPSAPKEEK